MSKRPLTYLFGNLTWTAPPWLDRLKRWILSHRLPSLAFVLFLAAACWIANWYQHRPQPERITVRADKIPVTRLEKELHPAALQVHFSGSVARLDQLGKEIREGVRLVPATSGRWSWSSDSCLTFQPVSDWPADQKYRIAFARTLFPKQVLLDRYAIEVTTPPFRGSVSQIEFYQDPRDPAIHQVVATLEFSHSVKRDEFERHLNLSPLGGSDVFAVAGVADPRRTSSQRHFNVTYGLHDRLIYVRSVPLKLPPREDFMKLTVGPGTTTTQGHARTEKEFDAKVRLPDVRSFFKIESVEGKIVRNAENEPEQILLVGTTAAAKPEDIAKALHLWLLPPNEGNKASGPRTVDAELLGRSQSLAATLVPAEHEQTKLHAFKILIERSGRLYLKIDRGITALGGYPLAEDYDTVLGVPGLPREIEIQGNGGILALQGERKLSIKSRGVAEIQYELARVATSQINHLVTQSEGRFDQPRFFYEFNEENISRIATELQSINLTNRFQANYSSFDFSGQLQLPADGGSERGLFFLRAQQWDPLNKRPIRSVSDRRFILVTDLGMLVKKSADGSSDVFVVSIKSGDPLAGVKVELLGKNGFAIGRGLSGPDGRVSFPAFKTHAREKSPVVFVARFGEDVAFMPFERADRQLDFTRFDIDGEQNVAANQLEAFLFTERGVYRPGDQVHIGYIAKQRDWRGELAGLPLEIELLDARGLAVQVRRVKLPAAGFDELNFATAYESPTGEYRVNLYLVRNGYRDLLIGSASFQVKEFLPDRMRLTSELNKQTGHGWIAPNGVQSLVTLRNLYGTPATDRRIATQLSLSPARFYFAEYKDYIFFDPLTDAQKRREAQTVDLGETKTDGDGSATVDLALERFADATYEMTLSVQGFEGEGGRSVGAYNSALISALPHVVGYKADSQLDFLVKDRPAAIDFIALDPQLHKVALDQLRFNLIERTYVSILTKKENGDYAYESVLRETPINAETLAIGMDGLRYPLATAKPGSFLVEVRDASDRRLSQVAFTVVGEGSATRSLARNAELQVKLDRQQYSTGDEIELSITAPYTGAGLIMIENNRVQAHQWFKSSTTSSVQRIRVPEGFDGTGYVNVSFVRALDSKEIFMSPLSYAVVPFTVNKEKRRLQVTLTTNDLAKPGEPFRIGYKTDQPARIVIFAVDQGILQVTDFETPDPLSYFFRKTALAVETSQIVDLILPEFSILRATSSAGGDGDAEKRLNPFKRVTEKPVVFWSGVIDADSTEREVVYDVPDYFDGTLTVMAVAVAADQAGSAEKDAIVRGPFVITPSVPTMVAPGDRFEVGVTVANNVAGSGENAEVALTAEPSVHLEIVKSPAQLLRIAEGRETTAIFTVLAKDQLGAASLTFHAFLSGGEESTRSATLSVRPPVPFMTAVRGGNFPGKNFELPVEREMYSEFRQLEATVSALPLGLARGLDFYLKNFPHGCSEQLTSASFSRLLLADEADFGLSRAEVNTQLEKTFATLRRRQNDQGAFGYWSAEAVEGTDFISVYVTHFLIEAKAAGFPPPNDILQSALRHLQTMASRQPGDLTQARTIAYAIYVLTRSEVITTNYILNLTDYLEKNQARKWKSDLAGVYLAGAWSLLRKDDEAERLINAYRLGKHEAEEGCDFYQPLGADAQYIAVVARHFPDLFKRMSPQDLQTLTAPIGQGEFSTLSAAYAVLALKSLSQQIAASPPELGIVALNREQRETPLAVTGKFVRRSSFSANAIGLRFRAEPPPQGLGAFYQIVEAGFDRHLPAEPIARGLEIYRELLDAKGNLTTTAKLGEPLTVRLRIRSLGREEITNIAITDLLPGGFEIVDSSLSPGVDRAGCDYVEVREDRALFFGSVGPSVKTITYQIKPCNRGMFVVPPPFAESMYERGINARGTAAKITVIDAK
ncbi:alpha-2-macroglobulin [soil metagenome]